jgi:hypothetical protein
MDTVTVMCQARAYVVRHENVEVNESEDELPKSNIGDCQERPQPEKMALHTNENSGMGQVY